VHENYIPMVSLRVFGVVFGLSWAEINKKNKEFNFNVFLTQGGNGEQACKGEGTRGNGEQACEGRRDEEGMGNKHMRGMETGMGTTMTMTMMMMMRGMGMGMEQQ